MKVIAQVTKFNTLSTGGSRLTLDLFESREEDIAYMALLANRQEVIEFEPMKYEEKSNGREKKEREPGGIYRNEGREEGGKRQKGSVKPSSGSGNDKSGPKKGKRGGKNDR